MSARCCAARPAPTTSATTNLSVAIDGKISVMDIELKGSGNSPEAIRNKLTGTAQAERLSSIPPVTRGSLDFARFATGVGSIFSDDMAFNSAMLQGFINRQSTDHGPASIAAAR